MKALALLLLLAVTAAKAAAPLPPAPINGWCYDAHDFFGYNGVRECPGAPANDPGAYTTLPVTWLQTPPITQNADVTQFFNLFGHIKPTLPVQGWPGAGGATVKYQDTSSKYLRLRMPIPMNPGTISHFIKLVSYGTTPGAVVSLALVPAGAAWPTGGVTPCYIPQARNDQPAINVNPGAFNSTKCSVTPGSTYDLLVNTAPNGWVALSWN